MKQAFQRKCMACNIKKNKYEFIRIVKNIKGEISLDETGKENGRGAYICNNMNCLEKVIKTNKIAKVFKCNIDKKIYEDIRGVIIGNDK